MNKHPTLTSILVLIFVAALTYLPLINKIGYTHDDWYLMSSARAEGAGVFHPIYSVDRPLRAYVLEAEYAVFGGNVLLYNLSAWVFRVVSAVLFLWWLNMLWPGRTRWTFLMALLYLIYPGFLSQQNGIDYQSQILSLALAMSSLGLTVHAYFESRLWLKWIAIISAIVLGGLYLGLVEYEAGFELIRLLIVFLLVSRTALTFRDRILTTIKTWLPYSLIVLGFGIWRFFFFESERAATDADLQFESLRLYPIQTVYHWSIQVVQDLFDVFLSAWAIPFSQLKDQIQVWGSVLAFLAIALALFVFFRDRDEDSANDNPEHFAVEALWLGLLSAVAGLIPIAMVNREVAFPSFSRYALVSAVGVAIFIAATLFLLRGRILRSGILIVLLLIGVLTHHANAVRLAAETAALRNFWWQVAWRAPQLAPRTTIVGTYPVGGVEEDYFLWGPASLIYYPDDQNAEGIGPGIYAAVLNKDTVTKVVTRERQEFDNRKNIITYKNYRNILVLSQPNPGSCVRVINGLQPEYSQRELDSIRVIGPYSEIEHILVDQTPHTPPALVFGPEPDHGWCYYYQKADLARQQGNWDAVLQIGQEAFDKGLAPQDSIEWMPFLQAYAHSEDLKRLEELAPYITASPYVAQQACQIIQSTPDISEAVVAAVSALYCAE